MKVIDNGSSVEDAKKGSEEAEKTENAGKSNGAASEKNEEAEKKPEIVTEESEMDDNAKRVMKLFCNVEKMYITKNGGVFDCDTNPELTGGAILYKNPYYKK